MVRIRNQNRGMNRNGLIDEEASDVSVYSRPISPINLASFRSTLGSVDSLHVNLPQTRLKGLLDESYLRVRTSPS
jgi:hypothetical protein